jgi:NAD(P)-dependent dehydrogenase (short-subunit alcohol dehydrogenase family)
MGRWTVADIPDQSGRRAIVTGANSGLGLEVSLEIARRGGRVILACRDEAHGRAALERVLAEAPGADVELRLLDLADLSSVREFAGVGEPVDLLVNNAGVMRCRAARRPMASRCTSAPTTLATSLSPVCCCRACSRPRMLAW